MTKNIATEKLIVSEPQAITTGAVLVNLMRLMHSVDIKKSKKANVTSMVNTKGERIYY